ncbi:aldo/keto reductase [Alpinimonas psychrophila]|uniref:Diketogulonate reductase-like aldo/keto reductase n=1 Tax=Alpinimonas psychrophila TaxID=748908 RepID=A0A7W3JS54_9MICO|nr:aldo/keto reductase [Alpinimonas psychrophila]MBA8828248.1 diketogulonate reductase-like aldo/keto reductase [Alpinimonas psychrophila]
MTSSGTIPIRTLNDGLVLPQIGLGTYKLVGDEGVASIVAGIHSGYRLLDTAASYDNEGEVGRAIGESGVAREDLIITTKLPGSGHGFDECMNAFETSRAKLGIDVVDLYLIHWPNPSVDRYMDAWQAMMELKEDGLIRSIGVCNFTQEHLTRLIDETGIVPSVNQVELHPYFPQAELRAFHATHNIVTECWSPLGRGTDLLAEPAVLAAATAHGVSPAQAVLRWHTQMGLIAIPKSGMPSRQKENLDVFGFTLSEDEMTALTGLERGRLWGGDPNTHEEL